MKRLALFISLFVLAGCANSEPHNPIKRSGTAEISSTAAITTAFYNVPYTADRENHPMDSFVPKKPSNEFEFQIEEDVKVFGNSDKVIIFPSILERGRVIVVIPNSSETEPKQEKKKSPVIEEESEQQLLLSAPISNSIVYHLF